MPDQPTEHGPWSWDVPSGSTSGTEKPGPVPAPAIPARALTRSFGQTAALTVAGTILPGVGLIAARRKVVGGVVLGVFGAALLTFGLWAALDWRGLLAQFVKPSVLYAVSSTLVVVALAWVGVVVASHLSLRGRPSRPQRVAGGVLVALLAFTVAAPMAVAARYSYDTASSVQGVFQSETDSRSATRPTLQSGTAAADPWADKPRLNVLLLGGDAGPGRVGTRTDTVILASIDTRTGDTTLFSLPRNTVGMPFPPRSKLAKYYPNGFTDGNSDNPEFFLNSMYDNVPDAVPADLLGQTDNLGADALKLSVGEALGLQVDYYVLINLQGFSKMINALGGIRVNINTYIPIGGNTDRRIPPEAYLKPGPNQLLKGRDALWYARGRYGSDDFARMDRQRCVIDAIIKQANPGNMLSRYEDVAKAGQQIVLTDMPQEVLPLMVNLGLRVKNGNVRSVVFKHDKDGFYSNDPDFNRMRQRVKVALGEAKAAKPSTARSSTKPSSAGSSSTTAKPKTQESEDVADSCAFNPEMAATATPEQE